MTEPIILYFDYKKRGDTESKEIELEVISPEFYDNGKKALKIYSNLLDIHDRWQNKSRFEFYKLMKEAGYTPSRQFFDDIDVKFEEGKEYTPEERLIIEKKLEIKGEAEYLLSISPSYNSQMYFEMYQYLVENLFLFVFKHLDIEWTNPSVPFIDIAKAYYSVWQNVFFGSVRDTKKNLKEEKEEEKKNSDAETPTNTPSESETSQPDQKTNLDSLPVQMNQSESQSQPVETMTSTPELLIP